MSHLDYETCIGSKLVIRKVFLDPFSEGGDEPMCAR